jgi:hypothetical protein
MRLGEEEKRRRGVEEWRRLAVEADAALAAVAGAVFALRAVGAVEALLRVGHAGAGALCWRQGETEQRTGGAKSEEQRLHAERETRKLKMSMQKRGRSWSGREGDDVERQLGVRRQSSVPVFSAGCFLLAL